MPSTLQLLEQEGFPWEEIHLEWLSLSLPPLSSSNFHKALESLLDLGRGRGDLAKETKPLPPRLCPSLEQR